MTDKIQRDQNGNNPREIPTRQDPGKINPEKDPDFKPGKSNPVNPETDEPSHPKNKKHDQSDKQNPIQDNPGKQITS